MVTKVIFLLALFGFASSILPKIRVCDPEKPRPTPTLCSNNKNIEYLDKTQTSLENRQTMLEKKIEDLEGESLKNNAALEILATNISSIVKDLEMMKTENERKFKDAKEQLEKDTGDVARLKTEVRELSKHRQIVSGNFSEIEKKLDATERQLSEKKAKLENLETETETALNETQRLLNVYKNELSQLNMTAQELEVKVEAGLVSTRTELEAKLKKVQNNSEAFTAKLKAEVDQFKKKTDNRLTDVDKKLKEQKTTADEQNTDIGTLKSDFSAIQNGEGSNEGEADELNTLKQEVKRIKNEVSAKVAFSATVIESSTVFTGPATTRNNLIFDRVFTNIGGAYNCGTGIFTAELKGVYHFSFMTFGYNHHTSGAILVKNGHLQVSTWEFKGPDSSDTTSNTVILDLNVGDTVNIILWKGGKINTGVFSGFLVFPTS